MGLRGNMQKLKIIVAYDGTDFSGWQKQPHAVSVSSTLEQVYKKVFGQELALQEQMPGSMLCTKLPCSKPI